MKYDIDKNEYDFDTAISASDWKYSAAITGLIYYFKELEKKYEIKNLTIDEISDSFLLYNKEDITEDNYLDFIEAFYPEDTLAHKKIENQLKYTKEFTPEIIKSIKENMSANTVSKKVFSKIKFDGINKEEALKLLEENRHLIIKETFRNKKDLYDNYCQTSRLLEKGDNSPCRLKGYYFDPNRKSKTTGYNFTSTSVDYFDDEVFDFIPFAFTGNSFETIFLNDNLDLEILENMNYKLREYFSEEKERENEEIKKFKQEKAIKEKRNEEIEEIEEKYLSYLTPTLSNPNYRYKPLVNRDIFGEVDKSKLRLQKPISGTPPAKNAPTGEEQQKLRKLKPINAMQNLASKDVYNGLDIGTNVYHERFGKGKVVGLEGSGNDKKAQINFEVGGLKNILLRFAKLTIVN